MHLEQETYSGAFEGGLLAGAKHPVFGLMSESIWISALSWESSTAQLDASLGIGSVTTRCDQCRRSNWFAQSLGLSLHCIRFLGYVQPVFESFLAPSCVSVAYNAECTCIETRYRAPVSPKSLAGVGLEVPGLRGLSLAQVKPRSSSWDAHPGEYCHVDQTAWPEIAEEKSWLYLLRA